MKLWFSRLLAVILAAILVAGTASAQPTPAEPASQDAAEGVEVEAPTYALPRVYIIRLEDPPLASYQGTISNLAATNPRVIGQAQLDAGSPASLRYGQYLERQQEQFTGVMQARLGREVEILFSYQVATNGLAVRLTPDEAQALASLPGVVSVQPEFVHYPSTDVGPAWIGAPGLWDGSATGGLPGTKGEGIVIGVLDTGINFDHPSFADIGGDLYDHTNPLGSGNYLGWCNPAHPNYDPAVHKCNDKLIGAWDFTGEASKGEDTNGHGSHTASTAAGNVTQATVAAPTTTIVRNISGVAPHANIVAYDVCIADGCLGAAILAGIDQAVADGVDVINYSIGGPAYDPWTADDALAFLAARDAGVFVATSAGNSGPGALTVGSPADAPWLLAAGASTHNRRFVNSLTGMSGGGSPPPADMQGTSITAAYGSHLIVHAAAKGDALCLAPFPAGTWTNGEIVVCDRGTNARVEKAENVKAGGAGGFVLANTAADGESLSADAYVVPGVHLGYTNSQTLRAWLGSGTGQMAAISGTAMDLADTNGDVMAHFSSRGPNGPVPAVIKPDVTTPGVAVLAASRNGVEFESLDGTSMASPHAAGAAALLKDLHPGWTPAEIQSALMTTASTANLRNGDGLGPVTPFDYGAGRIDLGQASRPALVLDETRAGYEAANPALGGSPAALNLPTLANGDCGRICSWTRTVKSVLPAPATWTATVVGAPPGLLVSVTPTSFALAPGVAANLDVMADTRAFNAALYGKDGWAFAWLELATPGQPVQRLPIAVRKSYASTPALLTKVPSTLAALPGETVSYFITLSNGDSVANSYSLVDTLPPGVEYVAGSATGGLVYNAATRQLTWSGQVAQASDYAITPVAALPYVNLADLGARGICATYFPTDCDDKAIAWNLGTESYTFYRETLGVIVQSSNGLLFGPDGWLGQACPACNQYLPEPVEINQVMAGLWRDARPGRLGKGEIYASLLTGLLSNPQDKVFYANWHDVGQSGDLTITASHAIAVVLNGQSEPAGRIYYIYANSTGDLATNGFTVGVEDKHGERGATWAFAQCPGGACIPHAPVGSPPASGTTLRLDPVATQTFTYQVRVTVASGALLTNSVRVTSTSPDPEARSMWAKADVTVRGPALYVRKSGAPGIQSPGEMVTYTISFGNLGDQDVTGVVLSDTLPVGVDYAWSDPAGAYDGSRHEVVWTGLNLPSGSLQSATVAVTIQPGVTPGSLLFNRAYLINGTLPAIVAEFAHLAGTLDTRIYVPIVSRN
jgi:uncharacterized repeat protein (TIGR01451 family)